VREAYLLNRKIDSAVAGTGLNDIFWVTCLSHLDMMSVVLEEGLEGKSGGSMCMIKFRGGV
jgi:hypothetical protein